MRRKSALLCKSAAESSRVRQRAVSGAEDGRGRQRVRQSAAEGAAGLLAGPAQRAEWQTAERLALSRAAAATSGSCSVRCRYYRSSQVSPFFAGGKSVVDKPLVFCCDFPAPIWLLTQLASKCGIISVAPGHQALLRILSGVRLQLHSDVAAPLTRCVLPGQSLSSHTQDHRHLQTLGSAEIVAAPI